jgi:hypothetical protein
MRGPVAIAGAALLAGGLAGCESSQTKSARLAREGAGAAKLTAVAAGPRNREVRVARTKLLRGPDGTAAAVVELRNTGTRPQARVPVQISVRDGRGRPVYKNDLRGLQPALQQLAYLGAGRRAYWVHNQVLAARPPRKLSVRVGRALGKAPAGRPPKVVVDRVRIDRDSTGRFVTGRVRNLSAIAQRDMPIYGVALREGRVVAAGRAIIDRVDPAPTPRRITFRMFFVGDPRGARLVVQPVPTVLEGR